MGPKNCNLEKGGTSQVFPSQRQRSVQDREAGHGVQGGRERTDRGETKQDKKMTGDR